MLFRMELKLIEEKRPQRVNRAQKVEMSTCFKLNEANIQRDGEWAKNKNRKNKVTFCILKPSKYEEYFINVCSGDRNNNEKKTDSNN